MIQSDAINEELKKGRSYCTMKRWQTLLVDGSYLLAISCKYPIRDPSTAIYSIPHSTQRAVSSAPGPCLPYVDMHPTRTQGRAIQYTLWAHCWNLQYAAWNLAHSYLRPRLLIRTTTGTRHRRHGWLWNGARTEGRYAVGHRGSTGRGWWWWRGEGSHTVWEV